MCWTVYNISADGEPGIDAAIASAAGSCEANVSAVIADRAIVNANLTSELAAQAAAQAAVNANVTEACPVDIVLLFIILSILSC